MLVRSLPFLLLVAALVLPASSPAQGPGTCTNNWIGPDTGNWNVPGNWSAGAIPGPADFVCIRPATDTTVNYAATIRGLRSEGIVRNSSELSLTDTSVLSAITDFRLGTRLSGAASVEVGTLTWGTGFMSGTGTTTVTGHSTLTGGGSLEAGRTLVTRGTGTWSGNRGFNGNAQWTNSAAATVTSGSFGANEVDTGTEIQRPRFHNLPGGSVTKTGSGNFTLGPMVDNDGTMVKAADATGDFTITDAYDSSSGSFDGMRLSAPAARPLRLAAGARAARIEVTGHVIIPPGQTFEAEDVYINSGVLDGDGTLVLRGNTTAYYGHLGSPGTKIVQPAGATLTWTAAMGFFANRMETAGVVTVVETGLGRPQNAWGKGMVWENTGEVHLQSGLFPTLPDDTAAQFINRGRLIKEGGGTFTLRPKLVNHGRLEMLGGRLNVTNLESAASSVLSYELRTATPGSGYAGLTAATFLQGGRLETQLAPGFAPPLGTRFQIITSPNRTGHFTERRLGGFLLDESQKPNAVLVMGTPVEVGKTANASVLSGTIRIKRPGSKTYTTLTSAEQIPLKATIDARKGHVAITAATAKAGVAETAEFYDGVFTMRQKKSKTPVLEARLTGSMKRCKRGKRRARKSTLATASAKRKKPIRRLWGSAKGNFRTRGNDAVATVRGTTWLVEDYCDSTLVKVSEGVVSVKDLVRKRTVKVKAGKQYRAKSRKR